MDTSFLSLPMGAGPLSRDTGMTDELGNTVYRDAFGNPYTIREQAPNRGSYVRAGLHALDKARKAPLESLTAGAQAIAQGAWDAVAAPGRSWSDSTTYGDVASTAGLVSLPAVAGKYDPAVANMGGKYAYHATGSGNISGIRKRGLLPHDPEYGNAWNGEDQSVWPDGAVEPRIYAGETDNVRFFAGGDGEPTLLRLPRDRFVEEEYTGDLYAIDAIPPEFIEIETAPGVFEPLRGLAETPRPRIRAYHGSPHDFDRKRR